jgi:hypothetical protein
MRTRKFQLRHSTRTLTVSLVLFLAAAIPVAHAEKVDPSKSDPLKMFGLTADEATVDKVKKLWRAFASENHPDKFLVEMEKNGKLRERVDTEARRLIEMGTDPLESWVKATQTEKDRRTNEFIAVSNANEGLVRWLSAGKTGRLQSNSGARPSQPSQGRYEPSGHGEQEQQSWEEFQKRNGVHDMGPSV